MKKFLCLLTVASLPLLSVNAQPVSPPGADRAMFSGGAAKLFGENSAFSATLENTVMIAAKQQTVSIPGHMAFDSGKSRFEMDLTQAKGMQIAPQMVAQLKMMGMDRSIAISRPDKKVAYVVYPGLQAYAETPLNDPNLGKPDSSFKLKTTELGKETIEGHPCLKNKTIVTDDRGTNHEFTVWNATDLKNFPVRIETMDNENAVTMVFSDVKLAKPEASSFDPPSGYQKYPDMQTMMQAEVMKRMAPGIPPGMTPGRQQR